MMSIYHALGLHMHQPPDNLKLIFDTQNWEAIQIIKCYERVARYAHAYMDVARLHIGFSGILLEQFMDPKVIDRYRNIVDLPRMIEAYRAAKNIEFIGMGYFHPIFPLIPMEDWEEQIRLCTDLINEVFGRRPKGFWPPEMAFSMEMIPIIKKCGYKYVIVDGVHVFPEGKIDIYMPYIASFNGEEIFIIPRDRDLSNAQESGLDPYWFKNEVLHKVTNSPHPNLPRLVTTWTDGENGGWFRNMDEEAGFFGHFFSPYMEGVRRGTMGIEPISISEFLEKYRPKERAEVRTGAWNVGSTSGFDLTLWAGTPAQKMALEEIYQVCWRYFELKRAYPKKRELLQRARRLILASETSCYLFWGDAWLPRIYECLNEASRILDQIKH